MADETTPPIDPGLTLPIPAKAITPLSRIGAFHILGQIGEGGMGVVYKAEQRHPIRRIVAVKIIKLGFDTQEIIARFESERQALARMDHPNVAKVLDAGTTDTGRSYFVMEYVPGVPITRFADDNTLSTKQRLLLFIQACEAIAHAHTKAIIHRDIKASNVLAYLQDGKPTVRVIDFGVAKALTGDRLTDRTLNTDLGQVIGTYDSMSPEQADGSPDIDTRTDVYALGVLLYELLTGVKPFDRETLALAGDQERRRIIREVEPPRPSTRLTKLGSGASTIAAARQAKLDQLARELRSELEWIPLKAMRKERSRRYSDPLQLAQDIRAYLDHRPLLAGPESRAYRLRKFLGRNRLPVVTAAILLIAASVASVLYIRGIRTEQKKTLAALRAAEDADRTSQAVNDFLNGMLRSVDPSEAQGKPVLVRDVLDKAATQVDKELGDRPMVLASVLMTLAETYEQLGESARALLLEDRAYALCRDHAGAGDRRTIVSLTTRGSILRSMGRLDEAQSAGRQALSSAKSALARDDRHTLLAMNELALTLQALGQSAEAESLFREVLDRRRRAFSESDRDTLNAIHNVAFILVGTSRPVDAEPFAREALDKRSRVLGELHPDTIASLLIVGTVLEQQGRFDEAAPLFNDFLARCRKVYGEKHRQTILALAELGRLKFRAGDLPSAEQLLRSALDLGRQVQGPDHPDTLQCMNDLAFILQVHEKIGEAEPLFREALELRQRTLGPDHPHTIQSLGNLAGLLNRLGSTHSEEAQGMAEDAVARSRRVNGDRHAATLGFLNLQGNICYGRGNLPRAVEVFKQLYDLVPAAQISPADAALYTSAYGLALNKSGKSEDAIEPLTRAQSRCAAASPGSNLHQRVLTALIQVCDATGRTDQAATWRAALSKFSPTTGPASAPATTPAR